MEKPYIIKYIDASGKVVSQRTYETEDEAKSKFNSDQKDFMLGRQKKGVECIVLEHGKDTLRKVEGV